MDPVWDEYARWTTAIADVVYPPADSGAPAYLDLEEEVLTEIGVAAGHDGSPREGLRQVVRRATVSAGAFSLRRLRREQSEWRRAGDADAPPPCLPFLAVTVLAAEDMGNSDDGYNANNYYARLCALLELPDDSSEVRTQYMTQAEQLWGDLNRWLEGLEGGRGTPTAYALSYRYVGLPLSQALVREGDRRKLPLFFAQYGLPAGTEFAPEALERYLDAWLGGETCPVSASLKRLWSTPSARERIATVAAVELMSWDGTIRSDDVAQAPMMQKVGLMAHLRRGFMDQSLDLALTLRAAPEDDFAADMQVESAAGEWLSVSFIPAVANVWRTSYSGGIDASSVLEAVVALRQEGLRDTVLRHHPRSIVPLVHDELQSAFIEAERLQLNVESMLLVRTQANGRTLAANVESVLKGVARPGFTVERKLSGLPEGWTLITGVQLFASPGPGTFNELVPLARDQLTIAGGMRIPSRIRKWSVVAPPEIRASVESADSLRLVLAAGDDPREEPRSWASHGGALVVPLADAGLRDGDYHVALFAGDARSPLQQATIRLRSADDVDSNWHLAPRLVYDLSEAGSALRVVSASELGERQPHVLVDGALAAGASPRHTKSTVRVGSSPVWSSPAASAPAIVVRVGAPDPTSCVVTGAHYLEYPPYLGGWQPRYIDGVCRYCGLVKRSPGWVRARGGKKVVSAGAYVDVDVANLPAVSTDTGRLWNAALDAMMHLGGGPAASLSSIAAQIDGSALFTNAFPTRLEALGHIAVERSPDGTPERWEISPSCLVVRGPRTVELVGYWPRETVETVMGKLGGTGARLEMKAALDQPTRRLIGDVDVELVADAASDIAELVGSVTDRMLSSLPYLSEVVAALPRVPMAGFSAAERFDVGSASWIPTGDVAQPGAYRLIRGFERLHVFRSADDVAAGRAVQGSVHLVKHLAANALGKSLVAFVPKLQLVVVPLGCDLPGLYGRATVLASGLLPQQKRFTAGAIQHRALVYQSITQEQADLLVTLLSR